jgi:hypothetical protein
VVLVSVLALGLLLLLLLRLRLLLLPLVPPSRGRQSRLWCVTTTPVLYLAAP